MQAVIHSNEDVNWFEDAISKGLIKLFDYEDFSEMKQMVPTERFIVQFGIIQR